ncbi:response regulator transcription factor [Lyngbya confervoides]|uniref:Response regulator transcription factor n=1 Tax=Lyngbya confervoides BDU141951 TaxID=1574623 RepID=A0ABD4T7G2_9CYAN|nr:response regulator transcription factor [Lyngbya confervoides]MCM1984722.1 response regulator transcription factor [Lyngbya confervoides BDU141951]
MQATKSSPTQPLAPVSSVGQILIVEDEEVIRDTVSLALRDEGYTVITAVDGKIGLELIQSGEKRRQMTGESPLDLVILDIMLPGINGLDLCRYIRREGFPIPVLVLSAKGSEADRVVGLEVGADDYLGKPFGMRELVARCRALLRRQQMNQSHSSQALKCRDLVLYPQECRATKADRDLNLSPKEFKILELFMSYPRRVWPREQILEKIWGIDYIGDSKTVDVHIRWLREKIERDPSHPDYLVTVRGFGYRFG